MNHGRVISTERRATAEDLLALLEIEQSAFPKSRWAAKTTLAQRLEFAQSETWISSVDGVAVGFSNGFPIKDVSTQAELDPPDSELYQQNGRIWLLRNVAVRPAFQRQGVGKQLIGRQVASARDYGALVFRFTATENLTSYYRSLGFTQIRDFESFHGLPQAVWELNLD